MELISVRRNVNNQGSTFQKELVQHYRSVVWILLPTKSRYCLIIMMLLCISFHFIFLDTAWPSPTIMCALLVTGWWYFFIINNEQSDVSDSPWTPLICFQGRWQLLQEESVHWVLFCSNYKVRTVGDFSLLLPLDSNCQMSGTEHYFCDSSSSGTKLPENSLFTATINAGAFLCAFICQRPLHTRKDIACVLTNVASFLFSSAVLCFPPCPYHGETCLSFHAEQNCVGLWCGGSNWGICSWKL